MKRKIKLTSGMIAIFAILSFVSCSNELVENEKETETVFQTGDQTVVLNSDEYVLDLSGDKPVYDKAENVAGSMSSRGLNCFKITKISGKIVRFGRDLTKPSMPFFPITEGVADTKIWISELPITKHFPFVSDENGDWSFYIIKVPGIEYNFSFIYEKEGWLTTKSNVININYGNENPIIPIQYIDPLFFNSGMKPLLTAQLGVEFETAIVATVGKSWASMTEDIFPHGDPGCEVKTNMTNTDAIGPVYFNEQVFPDPTHNATSVDGGVSWFNINRSKNKVFTITANKAPFSYSTVKFKIAKEDIDNGVVLYIASPPYSVQGSNNSEPGEE